MKKILYTIGTLLVMAVVSFGKPVVALESKRIAVKGTKDAVEPASVSFMIYNTGGTNDPVTLSIKSSDEDLFTVTPTNNAVIADGFQEVVVTFKTNLRDGNFRGFVIVKNEATGKVVDRVAVSIAIKSKEITLTGRDMDARLVKAINELGDKIDGIDTRLKVLEQGACTQSPDTN